LNFHGQWKKKKGKKRGGKGEGKGKDGHAGDNSFIELFLSYYTGGEGEKRERKEEEGKLKACFPGPTTQNNDLSIEPLRTFILSRRKGREEKEKKRGRGKKLRK